MSSGTCRGTRQKCGKSSIAMTKKGGPVLCTCGLLIHMLAKVAMLGPVHLGPVERSLKYSLLAHTIESSAI
jgi:hypothetical protein